MSIVEFREVTRDYPKGVHALRGVDLDIPEGKVVSLLGRNGAGKTTLLRMIPALLHPTSGTVRVFGLEPWASQQEVKRDIGYVSENQDLPANIRIRDVTDMHASVYPTWDAQMAAKLLKQFGLDEMRKIGKVSKGQARQVALTCAVSHRPKLLVLDEPAGGLDPVVRREFLEVVIDLLADHGSTILFSSHILSDVDRIANHATILHEGTVLLDENMDTLKENICRVELAGLGANAAEKLQASDKCLRAKQTGSTATATLLCAAGDVMKTLKTALPSATDIHVTNTIHLGLEDIFIELTGEVQC